MRHISSISRRMPIHLSKTASQRTSGNHLLSSKINTDVQHTSFRDLKSEIRLAKGNFAVFQSKLTY